MATFTHTDKQRALNNAHQEIARIEGQDTPNRVELMAERARGYLEALTIMGAISAAQYAQLLGGKRTGNTPCVDQPGIH